MKADNSDGVLFKNFLEEKTKLKPSSVHVYVGSVEKFLKYDPDIDEIEAYNNFLIPLVHRKSSAHYYSAIKKFIEYKIDDGKLRAKLISELIKPTIKDPVRNSKYLNSDKLLEVINNMQSEKHQVIAAIQIRTGARSGDVLRMRRPDGIFDEDYKGKTALRLNIIGKGGKRNVKHIFEPGLQDFITNYITHNFHSDKYYFLEVSPKRIKQNKDNELKLATMNYHWYWADLKQALHSSGIDPKDFSTHDFRRCFARDIWEKFGHDLTVLKNALDHKQADTILRYLRNSGLQNKEILYQYQTQ